MRLGHSVPEEFLRGSKGMRLKPGLIEQPPQGASEALVVLDTGDDKFARGRVRMHTPIIGNPPVKSVSYLWANFEAWQPCGTHFHLAPLLVLRGCTLEDLAEPLNRSPEFGRRSDSHFVHHSSAMRFDRPLADAEHVSDLVIDQAAHDERK